MSLEITSKAIEDFYENFVTEPPGSTVIVEELTKFLEQQPADRKIAWVTSGGTTIPLEKNTVRFIDNFSGGNRGAASAEYFIEQGYSVIFQHRKRSLMPFHRHFLFGEEHHLDRFQITESGELSVNNPEKTKAWVIKYQNAIKENKIFHVPFLSIYDYFFWMKAISQAIRPYGKKVLFYSAAAVSDFYVADQPEHKIQSSNQGLDIHLTNVPKLIPLMKPIWTPDCMVITFKLETDESILDRKINVHIDYGVDMVIGNILGRYQNEVVICQKGKDKFPISRSPEEQKEGLDIEKAMICEISKRHSQYCK